MAKRKAARATTRRATGGRASTAGRRTSGARKKAAPARSPRAGSTTRTAKKATKAGGSRKAVTARKAAAAKKPASRKPAGKAKTAARRTTAARKTRVASPARAATPRSAPARAKPTGTLRKSPNLDRARRVVTEDEDIVQTPPSSLDLDRSASAARTGRRSLRDRFSEHTETSPALTAGDVDADWESAYSVGDEAPGGDNPTPDQDIVDDIGKAVGIEYQDNEELKGANKVEQRDKKRWELDPASSEDWEDR